MKVVSVDIRRRESYDSEFPNQMVGMVNLKGENGSMEVKISNTVLASIFTLIKKDVARVAEDNSKQASNAIEEAAAEGLLIEGGDKPALDNIPL